MDRYFKSCVKGLRGNLIGTEGALVAQHLLSQVSSQWAALVQFIEDFYCELTTIANFPAGRAWLLVGRCVGSVFREMSQIRSEIALLEHTAQMEDKSKVIWTVMRCHLLLDDFINLEFKSHPAIVKEISLFLLTERVDPSDLSSLHAKLDKAEAEVKAANKLSRELDDKLASHKRQFDNLKNEFALFKSSISQKISNRGGVESKT
jgi:hypothetical protein